MNKLTVKKLVLMTCLTAVLGGCSTLGNYNNDLSGIAITSFNPMTPLGNLYSSERSHFWQEVRDSFGIEHYTNRSEVQEQIRWLQEHPQYLYRVLYRSAPYLYFVTQQVRSRQLPGELALIPILESSYNARGTNASSGAAGIWQLMARTARGFGVKRNFAYDGRRDIFASTNAALTYFKYLHNFFQGDWLLAVAAYDMGEGSVRNRLISNYRQGRPTNFWNLYLPKETQIYVPRLLALAAIIDDPSRYHISLPNVKDGPYFAAVELRHAMNLVDAAKLAGMPIKDMKDLNPEFRNGVTPSSGSYTILMPIDKVETFKANLANYQFPTHPSWFSRWSHRHGQHSQSELDGSSTSTSQVIRHRVVSGDTLAALAKHYGVSIATIRKINHIGHRRLKPGQIILIKTIHRNHISKSTLSTSEGRTTRQKRGAKLTLQTRNYHVRNGDTLDQIAKKFGVSVRALKNRNGLRSDHLHLGQKLVIPMK